MKFSVDYTCPADGIVHSIDVTGDDTQVVPESVVCVRRREHAAAGEGRPAYTEVCNQVAVRSIGVADDTVAPAPTSGA